MAVIRAGQVAAAVAGSTGATVGAAATVSQPNRAMAAVAIPAAAILAVAIRAGQVAAVVVTPAVATTDKSF